MVGIMGISGASLVLTYSTLRLPKSVSSDHDTGSSPGMRLLLRLLWGRHVKSWCTIRVDVQQLQAGEVCKVGWKGCLGGQAAVGVARNVTVAAFVCVWGDSCSSGGAAYIFTTEEPSSEHVTPLHPQIGVLSHPCLLLAVRHCCRLTMESRKSSMIDSGASRGDMAGTHIHQPRTIRNVRTQVNACHAAGQHHHGWYHAHDEADARG